MGLVDIRSLLGNFTSMLKELYIHNMATIAELRMDFTQGFQVLTGETGAGKSVLVESIGLILGAKANAELVRDGSEFAVVEASFDLSAAPDVVAVLERLDLKNQDDAHELIIKRQLLANGKSKIYVNYQRATLKAVQELSFGLIDFTGQHSQMTLLDSSQDIITLDAFLGTNQPLKDYQQAYQVAKGLRSQIKHLEDIKLRQEERKDWLKFQLKEFDLLKVETVEDEKELKDVRFRLKNHAVLQKFQNMATQGLTDGATFSCLQVLQSIKRELDKNSSLSDVYADKLEVINELEESLQDLSFEISKEGARYADSGGLSVDEIESRLHQVEKLKRRFGPELSDVLAKQEELLTEQKTLNNLDGELSKLNQSYDQAMSDLFKKGQKLSVLRKSIKGDVELQIQKELKDLLMPNVRFEVEIVSCEAENQKDFSMYHERGLDKVQFLLSPNPGLAPKPLAKIASGGEMSRIFLAIKQVLAPQKQIMTFIFDEIDTGISGAAVALVGQKLKGLSKRFQVFCITHHAQIASMADRHYVVSKKIKKSSTVTSVDVLGYEDRVTEVARLMGGVKISEKNLEYAKELLSC